MKVENVLLNYEVDIQLISYGFNNFVYASVKLENLIDYPIITDMMRETDLKRHIPNVFNKENFDKVKEFVLNHNNYLKIEEEYEYFKLLNNCYNRLPMKNNVFKYHCELKKKIKNLTI